MKRNQLRLTLIKLLLCMAGLFVSTIVFNHVTAWGGVALSALSLSYAIKIISNLTIQQSKQDNEK